ncbi:protocadherin beta-16-like [Chelmon rostratus]|uniref:protocadherin beta-16-like n=1 Tax=Chelmon rostratus TaxID=109905 RepID=UPI001BEBF387|nr:protocadherin beta-16-like [Chelmon rostratus]
MHVHNSGNSWRRYVSALLFTGAFVNAVIAVTHYSVPEELEEGSIVANLASDLGLDVKTLSRRKMRLDNISGKRYLDVNKETGELYIVERIDREYLCAIKTTTCYLKMEATLESPQRIFYIEIEITDINDNPPHFRRDTINLDIMESTPAGERFSVNNAVDPDLGSNSVKTYLLGENEHFDIEIQTGRDGSKFADLILKKGLDREKQAVHNLILTAVDGGAPTRTGTASIIVRVLDTNDNAPTFEKDNYAINIMENSPVGTLVIKLNATDLDDGTNAQIEYTYSLYTSEKTQGTFNLNPSTGEITVKGMLNYEDIRNYEMEIIAMDKGINSLSGQCKIKISVADMNDNHPEISIKSFQSPIKENEPIDTVIAVVSVSDKDSGDNGVVDLHIPDNMPFKLRESSDNYYELVVSEPLDREKVPEYDVTFTVTDRGSPPLSDNETMTLELLDVNDNVPQFPQSFYTIRVMENNAPGALLSSLTAFDPDLHENQYLVYFILEKEIANTSMSMLFSINPENGNLYALKTFDYEIEKEFLFHIEARDSGSPPLSSNVTVHIIIVDQNDNAPVIVSPWRAHGSVVEEKMPRSTDKGSLVAKVIALDTDSVHNSRITYQFLQVTDATLFSLDQYNGEIRTMRMFSYRDPRHQRLVVVAKDNGEPALSATVTIKLSTVETAVKAYSDMTEVPLEYDIFSDLNLYLVIGLGSVSFLLLITILVTIVLKCQKPKASKAAPPCRNSVISERNSTIADSTLVSNDAYWYSLFLAETRKGKLVVRQPVPKGSRYIVSSIPRGTGLTDTSDSAASTLQTGRDGTKFADLILKKALDREQQAVHNLILTAVDGGVPTRTGTASIIVRVLDVNDNAPSFDKDKYVVDVMENSPIGSLVTDMNDNHPEISIKSFQSPIKENEPIDTVIAVVSVSDKDSGDNGVVDLHIPDNMPFKLRESSDNYYELVVSEPLDREKVPEYDVTFTVTDRGSPPLSDNETMTLELLDVNDNVPQFPQSFYTIRVMENNAPGALLSSLTAFDPDLHENQYLVYFILEKEIANTSMSMLFSINPENGNLYALKTFDYEIEKEFLFHIEARDSGSPPLSSNVTVHIIIVDQNDNAPVIVSPWRAHGSVVEEKIPRSTDKGSLVAKVIALDTDSVHNSRITYQFLQVTDATLFSLDQYNGEIRTMRMFSYRDPRHQRLVVVAKDNGEPALSATVTIKLSTVETAVKAYSDMTEVPLEYDIFSDLNLYLVIGLGSVSFLLLITILVTIVLKCQKPKASKATPPCRNSVISERNSTIADSTLVSNDAYWYSLFLAETRKGKLVVRQPVPKGSRYIVSSIPRGTGLTDTSDSAASTLQSVMGDWLAQGAVRWRLWVGEG